MILKYNVVCVISKKYFLIWNLFFFFYHFRNGSSGGGGGGGGSLGDGGGDSDFVVHRGRGITTLSSVIHGTHDLEPAGKPTNWGDNRKQSFAGRRSRRNSLSEDSQVEHFTVVMIRFIGIIVSFVYTCYRS